MAKFKQFLSLDHSKLISKISLYHLYLHYFFHLWHWLLGNTFQINILRDQKFRINQTKSNLMKNYKKGD